MFNSLPNNKILILILSKLDASADNKIMLFQNNEFLLQNRKHGGTRGKSWLPAFSPFPTIFC